MLKFNMIKQNNKYSVHRKEYVTFQFEIPTKLFFGRLDASLTSKGRLYFHFQPLFTVINIRKISKFESLKEIQDYIVVYNIHMDIIYLSFLSPSRANKTDIKKDYIKHLKIKYIYFINVYGNNLYTL